MPKEAGDSDLLEDSDSDEVPSDLEEGMDSDSAGEGGSSDEDESQPEDGAENSDALSLVEGSDNEDLLDLDAEIPMGLIEYGGSDAGEDAEEEEWGGVDGGQKRKRGDEKKEKDGGRRKKLRSLPTFASYEDYAKMIDEGPEDDI